MEDVLEYIYSGGGVRRYHNSPKINQNVAEHSFGVALVLLYMHPNPSVALIKAAILHDISEKKYGDFLSPAKEKFPMLKELDKQLNKDFWEGLKDYIDYPELTEEEQLWLDFADVYECVLFAKSENNEEVYEDAIYRSERLKEKLKEKGFSMK